MSIILLKISWVLIASLELSVEGMFLGDKSLALKGVTESSEPLRVTAAQNLPQISPSANTFEHSIFSPNLNTQEFWVTVNQGAEQVGTQRTKNALRWPFDESLLVFPPSNPTSAHFSSNIDPLSKKNSGSSTSYDSVEANSHLNSALNGLYTNSYTDLPGYPESVIDESFTEIIQNYLMHEQIYGSFSDQLHMDGDKKLSHQPLEVQKPETFPNAFTYNIDPPSTHDVGSELDWISFFGLNPSIEAESASNVKDNNIIGTSEVSNNFLPTENFERTHGEGTFQMIPDVATYSHGHNIPNYFNFQENDLSVKIKDKIKIQESSKKINKPKVSGALHLESFKDNENSSKNWQILQLYNQKLINLAQPDRSFWEGYNVQTKTNNELVKSEEGEEEIYNKIWNKKLKYKFENILEDFKSKIENKSHEGSSDNTFLKLLSEMDRFVDSLPSTFDPIAESKSTKLLKIKKT
ncbi:expressed protein [Phakopsora pachyrhizi]|uniref:Expressed protein n=1 Tax=Phakopsora pachyrhizi TaxID=170000 RepID=A0AAV0BM46_PHAPC|nr:expressed protein [Phakopsora pachyrhizi]